MSSDPGESSPAASSPIHGQEPGPYRFEDANPSVPTDWMADEGLLRQLRQATLTLLHCLDVQLEDGGPISHALPGGGEFACSHYDLPLGFAPAVEAEAARQLVDQAHMGRSYAFDGALPRRLAAVDALPIADQQDLARATARAYQRRYCAPDADTIQRSAAARSRSSVRPAPSTLPAAAAAPSIPPQQQGRHR